jgi:hypothetical protein
VLAHGYNTEAEGLQVLGLSELHSKTLSQKKRKKYFGPGV